MKTKNLLKVLMVSATLFAVGCENAGTSSSVSTGSQTSSSSSSSSQNIVTPVGIEVTSENGVVTLKAEQTLKLTATVYPENANQEVVWSSSNEAVALVDSTGLVTGVSVGTVEIVATSAVDSTVYKSFSLIVEEKEAAVINPESINITAANDANSLVAGETLALSATVLPEGASQNVTWTSSDEEVATVRRGTVTGVSEGSVTITATSDVDASVSQSISLTVEASGNGNVIETVDWDSMSYTDHATFMNAEDGTAIKVKGVVTHVTPSYENKAGDTVVDYYIQNDTEGFYVYAQDISVFPVTEGETYEVGGFKKYYYTGLREIVDVERCIVLEDKATFVYNDINDADVSSTTDMSVYHGAYVTATATVKTLPSSFTGSSYNVGIVVNDKEVNLYTDEDYMTADEYAALGEMFSKAVEGGVITFKGIMSSHGYGNNPANSINIVKSKDIEVEELTPEQIVAAAKNSLAIAAVVRTGENSITLPTSLEGYNATISWATANDNIIRDDGSVVAPETDTYVTLTATITSGTASDTKDFKVLVYGTNTQYETVAALDLEDANPETSYGNSLTKSSYKAGTVELGTPTNTWLLQNALISSTSSDAFEGTFSIRMQNNATQSSAGRIEIQEDLEINAVQFDAALYGSDATAYLAVEYSTDNGTTWVDVGVVLTIDSGTLTEYRVLLPETADRVAIYIISGNGKRVNVDNISLFK